MSVSSSQDLPAGAVQADASALRESVQSLLDALPAATCAIRHDGTIDIVNAAWLAFLSANSGTVASCGQGVNYLEVCDRTRSKSSDRVTANEVGQGIRDVLDGRLSHYEHDYPCHSPQLDRWFTTLVTPMVIAGVRSALVTHRDVTTVHNLRKLLAFESLHDPLTGLATRRLLDDRLREALADSASRDCGVAVAVVSLDRFRHLNQAIGRKAADTLLIQLSSRIQGVLNAGDTLARGSASEFVVVGLDTASANEAIQLCTRLMQAVQEPYDVIATPVAVTASIGVVVGWYPQRAEDLLHAADSALGDAKRYGAGRVRLYTGELPTSQRQSGEARQATSTTSAVPTATATALALDYQPVVDLQQGGAVVAVEAIARGASGEPLLVGSGSHLGISSETSGPVLSWALQQACRDVAGLTGGNNQPLGVGVSLPGGYLTRLEVTSRAADALAESGLEPARLVLQVPETSLAHDPDDAFVSLQALVALGVRIAVKGFGTSGVSAVQLGRYPISLIKLDQAFVAGIGVSPNEEAFCSSLISLADAIGATAVAEGVETAEQYAVLHAFGCRRGQGRLWSPAVAIADLPQAIETCASVPVPAPTRRRRAARQEQPEVAARIATLRASGASLHTIAAVLNRDETTNPTGMRWTASDISRHIVK